MILAFTLSGQFKVPMTLIFSLFFNFSFKYLSVWSVVLQKSFLHIVSMRFSGRLIYMQKNLAEPVGSW